MVHLVFVHFIKHFISKEKKKELQINMELWLMMYILEYLGKRVLTSVSLKCFKLEDGLVDV